MRKIIFGFSLVVAFAVSGCNSQLHQSMLVHENRRLEDALYTTHAQVAHLRRENHSLRKQQENEMSLSPEQSRSGSWENDLDLVPPVEMPKIVLPSESGTTEVPDSLKGSQMVPIWAPIR